MKSAGKSAQKIAAKQQLFGTKEVGKGGKLDVCSQGWYSAGESGRKKEARPKAGTIGTPVTIQS